MLPSCVKLVFAALALGALPVRAAGEPAVMVGNRTIERVCWEASWQLGSFADLAKKVNLRTHSLYAPYIDQDLQNRCVMISGSWLRFAP
jgi:hypothetical protein